MATTSPKLTLGAFNLGTGAGSLMGQGNAPEAWILYTTDDASKSTPAWVDATPKVRSFSTSRGRDSELVQFDAGTATLTLDNRARTFDPVINASIRPLNRWWILEQFTGETQSIFKGYAESYEQNWSEGGFSDATTTVECVDEFKTLALDALPATSPVRGSYEDLIAADNPSGYWRLNDDPAVRVQAAEQIDPNPSLTFAVLSAPATPSKGKGWN